MGRYRYARRADRDLADLIRYSIENWGEKVADRYILGLFDRLDLLAENPSLGRDHAHLLPGLRRYEHRSHSIYYVQKRDGLLIVRILGSAQDPARHLAGDDTA
jgi:toxin ParE1/3/4